jgi:hypothetical protein
LDSGSNSPGGRWAYGVHLKILWPGWWQVKWKIFMARGEINTETIFVRIGPV